MSLHRLKRKISGLVEIREILDSLKTMALIETRKLSRNLAHQQALVDGVGAALFDLIRSHPELNPSGEAREVLLVLGAERGFCGDFNGSLEAAVEGRTVDILLGRRLAEHLNNEAMEVLAGPVAAEEVPTCLRGLLEALGDRASEAPIRILALHHQPEGSQPVLTQVWPVEVPEQEPFPYAADLQLDPLELFSELMHHYLLGALGHLLSTSLLAENRRRLRHLEGALRHLDDRVAELTRRGQTLRQEEITNEIEVILASAFLQGSEAGVLMKL